jgi:TolB-like protein
MTQTPVTDLSPGEKFADRYEIEAPLGRGGMGAVYRAKDLALGEAIALKLLAPGPEVCSRDILRFRDEVRLARRVTHPNIARVYDIGEHRGMLYLTMELIVGETLRAKLRREGRIDPARAAAIARALALGLSAAHAAGVIHRDLKPPNVLIEQGGRVVISDFGIARSLGDASGLTLGAVGTPFYMAPEQLAIGAIDGRTDLYALGLVLYEMLTGAPPSTAPAAFAVTPAGAVPVPEALADVVRRCIARDPDARPASAAEVARMLAPDEPFVEASTAVFTATVLDVDRAADTRGASTPARASQVSTPTTSGGSDRTVGVLPFRFRGPREQEYFGEELSDELVDVLSRTRGLRVLGSGATARYRDARDPRAIGADLGAHAIIDGAVQMTEGRVRISVRLVDTSTAVQLWSERYEGDLGDVLSLQESIARRVAEELRVELCTLTHRGAAPAAAIERYLAGRHALRAFDYQGATSAAAALAGCLELAPDFAPGLAAHAIACLRSWFYDLGEHGPDWEAAARASVALALSKAPDLAETHLASAILATHCGDYRVAARALASALTIAPTYADAHEYLGMLQCESGRSEEGVKHMKLAAELDPTLFYAGVFLARDHALHGRHEAGEAALAEIDRRRGGGVASLTGAIRVRLAAWRRDLDGIRRWSSASAGTGSPNWRLMKLCADGLTGELGDEELRRGFAAVFAGTQNPRSLALAGQLATEVFASRGQVEEARLHLLRAATSVLVDLAWMDLCPLLAPLRALPDFEEARKRVRARAEAIWMA